MFNWIKNLTQGGKKDSPQTTAQGPKLTRTVRRIVPASQRNAEAEAVPPVPPQLPEASEDAEREAAPISLSTREASKPAVHAPIAFPKETSETDPELESQDSDTVPAVISLSPGAISMSEESESAPPTVHLAGASRKAGLKLDSGSSGSSEEIVLTVGDFIGRIPPHFVNENLIRTSEEVRFDAADLYSDMTKGRATVPLSIIAEVIPSLFKRRFSAEEDIEIQLPLPKIVAQMGDLLTRRDQEQAETFEEVETPFLKAAQQDQKVHKVSGAIAPQTVKPVPPLSFSPPSVENTSASDSKASSATNGDIKRVASGPKAKPSGKPSRRVTVRVRPLIQAMPIEQREALLGIIPEDSQVDLPLDEIEGQLPSGRVFLPLATFSEALNPTVRAKFNESFVGSDVPISLSEIVKNLPTDSFRLREDQLEQEVDPDEFETPFNTTPDSIAERPPGASPLSTAVQAGPQRAKPVVTPAIANYTTRKLNSTGGKFPSPMHAALGTQDALDAKKIVKLASALPGVASLTIITEDGLSLAGNLPSFMDPEGFSAMAPQLHRKISSHVSDMKLGELKHLSLTTENHAVTIFTGGGMCIAVLHQNQSDLGHGVREKFMAIVDGLARQYSPEEAAH